MAGLGSRDPPPGLRQVLGDEQEQMVFKEFTESQKNDNSMFRYVPRGIEFDSQRSTFQAPSNAALNQQVLSSCRLLKPGLREEDYTWDAVLDTIQSAEAQYQSKGETNRLRRIIRRGEPAAVLLTAACDMIPDDNGLSAIRAGLIVIFETWRKRIENVERILSALGDLPRVFSDATELWKSFRGNVQLQVAIHDLGTTVLDGIDGLICILQRKPKEHGGSAVKLLPFTKGLAKQIPQSEAVEITKILSDIERAKNSFEQRVKVLDQQRSAGMNRKLDQTLRTVAATRETLSTTKHDIVLRVDNVSESIEYQRKEIRTQFDGVQTTLQTTADTTEDLRSEVSHLRNDLSELRKIYQDDLDKGAGRLPPALLDFALKAFSLLSENPYKAKLVPPRPPRAYPAKQNFHVSADSLLNILNIPHSLHLLDRDDVLKHGRNMEAEAVGRGQWLLAMEPFTNLMQSRSSGLLLVDGCCEELCDGKVSPLSILCATLAASLDQTSTSVVLHFFCGEHCRPSDPIRGPQGLMRSLIHQLLLYPGLFDPEFAWMSDVSPRQLNSEDLGGLCYIFEELFQFLDPQVTVYCIVDGISEFEKALYGWPEQLKRVFETLGGIAGGANSGACLKLLMTSPGRSTRVSRMVGPRNRIALRAENVSSPGRAKRALARLARED